MSDDVTVVVTCFNYGAFLPESVASALSQEGGEPHVIVVDDGSTDARTLAELKRLPPQVELIRQANAGLSAARNTGLRRVQTPYALALDADDLLAPQALHRMRAPLQADAKLGFSYGIIRFFGDWEGDMRFPAYDPYRLLFRHNIGPSGLFRRKLFDDVGGYDPQFRGYEDWEFWVHALECGWHGTRVDHVTHLYRRHGTTMYHGARAHYHETFRLLRQKHHPLYTHAARGKLQAQSDLNAAGRLLYRWWWGARPLPARAEIALQSLLWRRARRLHS